MQVFLELIGVGVRYFLMLTMMVSMIFLFAMA
jgi:hypothetical protein